MNEFNKVEQSHRRKGLPSLFSDILHIELLLGPPEEEVYEIINSLGSGRKKAELIRNVPSSSLIAVENDPENFCLFLAIALTVRYRQIQETENKHFRRTLQKGFERLTSQGGFYKQTRDQMAHDLFNRMIQNGFQIRNDLEAYSVEEHVPIIQQYFYQIPTEEERCRLVVFGEVISFLPLISANGKF